LIHVKFVNNLQEGLILTKKLLGFHAIRKIRCLKLMLKKTKKFFWIL